MSTEHIQERAELVAGLRKLADWYQEHPEVPLPYGPTFDHCVLTDHDPTGVAEVAGFAEALGVPVTRSPYAGHYHADRKFAGLQFRAFYVPADASRKHAADAALLERAKANNSRAATEVPQPTGQGSPQVRDQSPGSGPGHNSASSDLVDRETVPTAEAGPPPGAVPDARTTVAVSLPVEVERGRRGPGLDAGEGQGTRPAGAGGKVPAPATTRGHPCIDVPPSRSS